MRGRWRGMAAHGDQRLPPLLRRAPLLAPLLALLLAGFLVTPAPGEGQQGAGAPSDIAALVAALGEEEAAPGARRALQGWIREQPGERQRPWLLLAATLEGVDRVSGFVAAQATLLAEGDPLPFGRSRDELRREGAALLAGFVETGGEDRAAEAPALLALAALLLEPADPPGAQRLRRAALSALSVDPSDAAAPADAADPARSERPIPADPAGAPPPLSPAWPRLVLAEARYLVSRGDQASRSEARLLLEDFLVRAPLHPQAPEARRLLQGIPWPPIPGS